MMQKIKYVFLIALYCSCSITKNENAPINDYLETQKIDDQKIMIIAEKINNNTTIAIFKGEEYLEPLSNKYERNEGVKAPFFDETKWTKMKALYENKKTEERWVKSDVWTLKDFKHKNILFFERAKFPNPGKYEKFEFEERYVVFSFSAPIYYDKKYAVFTLQKTTTKDLILGNTSVLILEKKKGKWQVIDEVVEGIYN